MTDPTREAGMGAYPDFTDIKVLHESRNTRVLRARRGDGTPVILKLPNTTHPTWRHTARLEREHALLASVKHDGLVRSYGVLTGAGGAMPALALEDFGGRALREAVVNGSRLPVDQFLQWALCLAEALQALAERCIIHGDVNPSNIVVNERTNQIKLIDLSLGQRQTRNGQRVDAPTALHGTLAYIAPEQTGRTNRPVDERTDLYSLGVTFYQMLTGALPFVTTDALELVHAHLARTPVPARDLVPSIPEGLSRIVQKLLAKTPDDRYQGGDGLAADLRRVALLLREAPSQSSTPMELGRDDACSRLHLPAKLYGREHELHTLLGVFERGSHGDGAVITISGDSGVGKSALARDLHTWVTARRGSLLAGKFDQLRRDTPMTAIVAALGPFFDRILAQDTATLATWRDRLLAALETRGRIVTELVPSVATLLGDQPALPEVSAKDARHRAADAFTALLASMATAEHPVVLFLDDLQWADTASLHLLRDWLTSPGRTRHVTFVLAYRHREVPQSHPFALLLETVSLARGESIPCIEIGPLSLQHVEALLADALHRSRDEVAHLAQRLHEKTAGNPFFIQQLLFHLYEQGALRRAGARGWVVDDARLAALQVTDNVVELMIATMRELDEGAQRALARAACIGSRFDIDKLATVLAVTPHAAAFALSPPVECGLLFAEDAAFGARWTPNDGSATTPQALAYRFAHDRVQQAAYELLDATARRETHLDIARLLVPRIETHDDNFAVLGHFLKAEPLLTVDDERLAVVGVALRAGRHARANFAYDVGVRALKLGSRLLGPTGFALHGDLAFDLHLELAHCQYLEGDREGAEALVHELLRHESSIERTLDLARIRVSVHEGQGRYSEAWCCGIACLSKLGVHLEQDPTEAFVGSLIGQAIGLLGARSFDDVRRGETVTDPAKVALQRFLTHLFTSAFFVGPLATAALAARSVEVALRDGNTEYSPLAFGYLALAMAVTGQNDRAIGFGQLACDLSQRFANPYIRGKIALLYAAWIGHRVAPLGEVCALAQEAYEQSLAAGDLAGAGNACAQSCLGALATGTSLEKVHDEATRRGEAARAIRSADMAALCAAIDHIPQALLGDPSLSPVADPEPRLLATGSQVIAPYVHLSHAVVALVQGETRTAWTDALRAIQLLGPATVGPVAHADAHYVLGLAAGQVYSSLAADERPGVREALERSRGLLVTLATRAPFNYAGKVLALDAELLAVDGRIEEALDALDQGIRALGEEGFIHWAALANERAARLLLSARRPLRAHGHMVEAHRTYTQWDARTKALSLSQEFPAWFQVVGGGASLIVSTEATQEHAADRLDLLSVLKASQTLAGELRFEHLVTTLMRTVFEAAGADCGALVLLEEGELVVAAEGSADKLVTLGVPTPLSAWTGGPRSVVQYVQRTLETVVVDDARAEPRFEQDPYVAKTEGPRSVLAMPLLKGAGLVAILLLENRLATHAFTAHRMEVLRALAGQMAMSIDNARLYGDVQRSLQAERIALAAEQEARRLEREAEAERMRVEKARQHLAASFEAARAVQHGLLVTGPVPAGVEVATFYRPADRAGGDWFGVYGLTTRPRLIVVLGDVTGHGIPSALVTAAAAGAAASAVDQLESSSSTLAGDLRLLVRALDQAVRRTGQMVDRQMTMALVALDLLTGEGAYLNAAHPPLLHASAGRWSRLLRPGCALGSGEDMAVETLGFRLDRGDSLVLFSDGLVENQDSRGKCLGEQRLARLLDPAARPDALVASLMSTIDAFAQNDSTDDTALVTLRFVGR